MHMRTRIAIFLVLLVITIFLSTKNIPSILAQEQSGLDITISPAILEFTATPGSQVIQRLRIWNNLSQPLPMTIAVDKLSGGDIHGQVIPIKAAKGDQSITWLHFNHTSFVAQPKEWTEVTLQLTVPKDAAFAYYYTIRFSQLTKNINTKNTKVVGNVAVPVLLEIKRPGARKAGDLIDFKTTEFINEYLPVDFTTIIASTGNVHIQPHGNIFIRNSQDQDIDILPVNEEQGNILPSNKREFLSSWTDGFIVNEPIIEDNAPVLDNSGNAKTHLVFNWNKLTNFRFGKYTAELVMAYDNGHRDVSLNATTTFWVIPYTIIGVTLFMIIIIIIIIKLLLSLYVKRQIKKYKNL